jgi:hypothetical protein
MFSINASQPPVSPSGGGFEKSPVSKEVSAEEYKSFCTVYGTNIGSKCINLAMRKQVGYTVSTSDTVLELQTRDQYFRPDNKEKAGIGAFCESVSYAQIKRIDDFIYARADHSRPLRTRFRGQGMTERGFAEFRRLHRDNERIHPTHFFSCDENLPLAKEFAQRHDPSDLSLVFVIDGRSSKRLNSTHASSEETESLFSTHTQFSIEKIAKESKTDFFVIRLKEEAPSPDYPAVPCPY